MNWVETKSLEEETDVGIKLANNLKPGLQCAAVAGKAKFVLSQVSRSFHSKDKGVFESILTIWAPKPRIFCTCMVSLARDGQTSSGKSTHESCNNDFRSAKQGVWG